MDMEDLDLPLTKEDVLGERCQFVPVNENVKVIRYDDNGNKVLVEEIEAGLYQDTPFGARTDVAPQNFIQENFEEDDLGFDSYTVNSQEKSQSGVIKPVANI